MSIEGEMASLRRAVAKCVESQKEAAEAMMEAAETINELRAENAKLRKTIMVLGTRQLAEDMKADCMFHKPQAG